MFCSLLFLLKMNFFDDMKNKVNDMKSKVSNLIKGKNTFMIKGVKYIEEKLLGEGGFGYVYLVTDERGKEFAIKKINILDSASLESIKKEISVWTLLNSSPNIIKLLAYEVSSSHALILMEYSRDGSLLKFINDELVEKQQNIQEALALSIFREVVASVHTMHSQNPPIAHRDIKIENILKVGSNYKLCDFGSASTEKLDYSKSNKNQIKDQFSKYERTTTFMYRPPELIDEYLQYNVSEKVDIWTLGCLLFALLYKQHPFFDAQKSAIVKVCYNFPDQKIYSEKIDDLIRWMITQNPESRPSTTDLLNVLSRWNTAVIPLCEETKLYKLRQQEKDQKSTKKAQEISSEQFREAQEKIIQAQKKKQKYKKDGTSHIIYVNR